jgi:hypothetical protein
MWSVYTYMKGKAVLVFCWLNTTPWRRVLLDQDASWWWVASFTPQSLYLWEQDLGHWMEAGLPQNWSGQHGERKVLTQPGLEIWPFGCLAHSQSLYWLFYIYINKFCLVINYIPLIKYYFRNILKHIISYILLVIEITFETSQWPAMNIYSYNSFCSQNILI